MFYGKNIWECPCHIVKWLRRALLKKEELLL
jgi:hypothetical protein